jgi:hypothetical protein
MSVYTAPTTRTTGDLITAAIWNTDLVENIKYLKDSVTIGWKSDGYTWVYASANTFTITGIDATTIYIKGTRVRWKDGAAYKYAVVTSSAFVSNTTVTFTGGADYTMANATITDNYFSYDIAPQNYPGWFNYVPSITGYSANPSSPIYRFMVVGTTVTIQFSEPNNGTSNTSDKSYTLPINALGTAGLIWAVGSADVVDNGVITSDGRGQVAGASPTKLDAWKSVNGGGWTTSGSCRFAPIGFMLSYEMA